MQQVRIVRSKRRKKTIHAREVGGILEVHVPHTMSDEELRPFIERFRAQLQQRRQAAELDDAWLEQRAATLNTRYFGGELRWQSVRWSSRQQKRYGSCTPADGTIRISSRLARMPRFVLDYVIVHELAHLLEANHSGRFWKLVNRYPRTERARGYLMAARLEGVEDAAEGGAEEAP